MLSQSTSASLWLGKLQHALVEELSEQHDRNNLLVAELLRSNISVRFRIRYTVLWSLLTPSQPAGRWCIVRLVDRLRFQGVQQSELLDS